MNRLKGLSSRVLLRGIVNYPGVIPNLSNNTESTILGIDDIYENRAEDYLIIPGRLKKSYEGRFVEIVEETRRFLFQKTTIQKIVDSDKEQKIKLKERSKRSNDFLF